MIRMDENGVGNSSAIPPNPAPAQQPAYPYPVNTPITPQMVGPAAQSVDGMMPQPNLVPSVQQQMPLQGQYNLPQSVQPAPPPPSNLALSGYDGPQAPAWPVPSVGQFSTIQDSEGLVPDPATYDPYAILTTEPMPEITIGDPAAAKSGILFKLIVVVLVIAIFAAGVYGGYLYGKSTSPELSTSLPTQQTLIQTAEPEEQQPSQSEDEAKITFTITDPVYKEEMARGALGEQVSASDGLILYVKNDVDFNYKTTDSTYQQSSDKKLLKVNYIVGNASSKGPKQIKASMFSLEDEVGTAILPESTIKDYTGKIDVINLAPGAKARFSVVYELGAYVGKLKVVRQQSYLIKSTNKLVVMRTEVNL